MNKYEIFHVYAGEYMDRALITAFMHRDDADRFADKFAKTSEGRSLGHVEVEPVTVYGHGSDGPEIGRQIEDEELEVW